MAQLALRGRREIDVAEADRAARQTAAGSDVAERRKADGGLASARLADEAQHLALGQRETHVIDDPVP